MIANVINPILMKKILVLDDDTDILYVVDLLLTHYNFVVHTTNRWSVISRVIKDFSPDLMIIDIDLNGADGCEICKHLKLLKENEKLPIILYSIHHMPNDYVKECNANGFISKPFKPIDLINIINQNLN